MILPLRVPPPEPAGVQSRTDGGEQEEERPHHGPAKRRCADQRQHRSCLRQPERTTPTRPVTPPTQPTAAVELHGTELHTELWCLMRGDTFL